MTVKETLKAARKLIANRKRWTRGASARNARSRPVNVDSPAACRWCAEGAVLRFLPNGIGLYWINELLCKAAGMPIGGSFHNFNDTHTHAEVLAVFDEAIGKAL
jgi:hypothetical protein